ncbi:MAG: glycosyltransferase [Alteromonadaceae bacterium]|uniref:glycosyltransferase n=1 Tax=Marinobacter sp. TaxID=50741 RepID=UPI0029C26DF8|nr:glycosyltransferase [Marinobacter sp.]MDX5385786.1 glycosyltransferase [Marinobacter sp.]MDX5440031.1 glycosyltransferase [Alteromonadaceae bacterium]
MSNLNILIVAYDWPPRNSIAVHRPYAWAKYWSRSGCNVTVLTSEKCVYDEPLDLEMPLLDGVRVIEVPYRASLKGGEGEDKASFKRKVLEFVKKHSGSARKLLGLSLDIRDAWAKKAIPIAVSLNESEKFDVVVSTYGPRACHFIGGAIKANAPSVFWVADYRDMWSIRHNSTLEGWRQRREQSLEKKVVEKSDFIATVSEPLVVQLADFLKRDVFLVANGYDVEFEIVKSRLRSSVHASDNRRKALKIVYTGMIYPGWQDPSPLFEAINELIGEGIISLPEISIDFFGKRQAGLQEIVSRLNAENYVKIHGHVSRQKALEEQASADLLLLMESGHESASGVLTGKVFEYMVSGKPVISIGSRRDSAIGKLIDQTGIGVVCEQDVQAIKKFLLDLMAGDREEHFSPNLEEIKAYNREVQSEELLLTIQRLVS